MKFLSVQDLRTKSARIWQELPVEREMIIAKNGKPIAMPEIHPVSSRGI